MNDDQYAESVHRPKFNHTWWMSILNRLASEIKALEPGVIDIYYLPEGTKTEPETSTCQFKLLIRFEGSDAQRNHLDT